MKQETPPDLSPTSSKMQLADPNYTPGKFIDWLNRLFQVRNDSQLARKLYLDPAQISANIHDPQPQAVSKRIGSAACA